MYFLSILAILNRDDRNKEHRKVGHGDDTVQSRNPPLKKRYQMLDPAHTQIQMHHYAPSTKYCRYSHWLLNN